MLQKYLLALLLLATAAPRLAHAQTGSVGIGTSAPDASAALDVSSTTQGLLLPRLSQAQRNALGTGSIAAPAAGLVIYQTDNTPGLYAYDGTAWVRLGADNLGNHTATQALNLQAHALIGTGANLGTVVGVGIRADGGLNLGQNTAGNGIYLGYQAGQSIATTFGNNQFIGYQAGQSNTTGYDNQFSGYQSGQSNTTGNSNYFSGYQAGQSNTIGNSNYFSGYKAGQNNTTGDQNIFLGYNSGRANSTGDYNLFLGYNSGRANQTGSGNLFMGYYSGWENRTGSNNVFLGNESGMFIYYGNNNTALGYHSGYENHNGSNNTFLGSQSDVNVPWNSAPITNSTALGNGAKINTNNTIQLGNSAIGSLRCQVGLTVTSDARFKYDVQANVPGLAFIERLRPVTYRLDADKLATFQQSGTVPAGFAADPAAPRHTGFLAQEVEQAAQGLHYTFDGVHAPANARDYYGLSYAQFVVPLVQAVQELSAENEALQARVATAETKVAQATATLETFEARLRRLEAAGAQAQR